MPAASAGATAAEAGSAAEGGAPASAADASAGSTVRLSSNTDQGSVTVRLGESGGTISQNTDGSAVITGDNTRLGQVSITAESPGVAVLGSPGNLDGMAIPRSPTLGATATMSELLQTSAVLGSQGVTLLVSPSTDPSTLYGAIFELGQENGIEYALTRENGGLVLRSGALDTVRVPQSADLLAHTHPYDPDLELPQTGPSRLDANALNGRWSRAVDINPSAERPMSDIIWGSKRDQVTSFGATGLEQILDPTKGGLKPGRSWQ